MCNNILHNEGWCAIFIIVHGELSVKEKQTTTIESSNMASPCLYDRGGCMRSIA